MKKIEGNPKLLGYYRAFIGNFSKVMIGYFSIASGMIEPKVDSTMGDLLSFVGEYSPFGGILKAFGSGLKAIEKNRINNKSKRATMFGDITSIETLCQNVARQYAVENEKEIEKFNEGKRDSNSFFSKI